ncbi:MAG TPA: hypothetical protein PK796_01635 [Bacteroidales bacterium]|nr:hypothetical protein [Bacteroidales bacterium]
MEDLEMHALKKMELAPWIQKATALIGNNRNVGGNQFRHCMAAMIILIDYHFIDSVMLKASITHDLLEDSDKVTPAELMLIDDDSPAVLALVNELTHNKLTETKEEYFDRLVNNSSPQAKIVKLADRISNLTDLHLFVFSKEKTEHILEQTEEFIYPMIENLLGSGLPEKQAMMVQEMKREIHDLVAVRRHYLEEFSNFESVRYLIARKLQHIGSRITNHDNHNE